jgi:oligopeptide transport system substrate-binding protein
MPNFYLPLRLAARKLCCGAGKHGYTDAMRNLAFLVPPLLANMLLLAACGDQSGGELNVAVIGDGPMAEALAAEATSATLVKRGANGELATGLATSWRFLDEGDALILRLAPLRWPGRDGRPGAELVAGDVVASLRRPRGAAARAMLADAGLTAKGNVRAPINRVVELLPRPPTPFLLEFLAEPALALRNRRGVAYPGAYTQRRDGTSIRLSRRSNAATADAQAASIIIDTPDVAAAVRQFVARDVHVVLGEGLAGLGTVRAGATGRALIVEPVHGVIGLAIAPSAAVSGGRLADPRLRRALLLAADGELLANRFALSALQAQTRLWDGLPAPLDDRRLPPGERLAKASTLLAATGHGPAKPLALTVLVPAGAEAALIARELAASWVPLGISLEMVRQRRAGSAVPRHDLALQEIVALVPDAAAHLARWRCGRAVPCNPAADRLLRDARDAGNDLATRAAAIAAAEAALMADPAFIPLLRPVRWALVANGVSGFRANPFGRHPLGRMLPPGARAAVSD